MMTEEAFAVSLRVTHPTYAHQEIVASLGMTPEFAHTVGTPRMTPKGRPLDGIYKETYCSFSLVKKQAGYFADGVRELLPLLNAKKEYLHHLRSAGGRAELYVGVFVEGSSGFTFAAEDMSAFVDLRLDVAVEYYC